MFCVRCCLNITITCFVTVFYSRLQQKIKLITHTNKGNNIMINKLRKVKNILCSPELITVPVMISLMYLGAFAYMRAARVGSGRDYPDYK